MEQRSVRLARISLTWLVVAALAAVMLAYAASDRPAPERDVRPFDGVNAADQAATLSLQYFPDVAFFGFLSTSDNCEEERLVTIYAEPQGGSGPGVPILFAETGTNGFYDVNFLPVPGTYHAEVSSEIRGDDNCLGAVSGSVVIAPLASPLPTPTPPPPP